MTEWRCFSSPGFEPRGGTLLKLNNLVSREITFGAIQSSPTSKTRITFVLVFENNGKQIILNRIIISMLFLSEKSLKQLKMTRKLLYKLC